MSVAPTTKLPARRIGTVDVQMVRTPVGDLSERAYRFAEFYVERGGRGAGKCAADAGFAVASAGVTASRLLRDERVLALIDHLCRASLRAAIVTATEQLKFLAVNGGPADAVKLRASEAVLDRASKLLAKITEHRVTVEDKRPSRPDNGTRIIEFIEQNAADLGIAIVDRTKLQHFADVTDRAAANSNITDAEFEEITDEREDGTLGLEDLLR